MIYELAFKEEALVEWDRLDGSIKKIFKAKLQERLSNPKNAKARLNGMKNAYKIKLRSSGFRLVYQVIDERLVVIVVAVGKREKNTVYKAAIKRV